MVKLFKYFKPYIFSILAIVALLFAQAMTDLSLPDYMSNIVNIGIQQGGIEYAAPEVIRKTELDKILIFLDEGEKEEVQGSYKLDDSYKTVNNEPVYKLSTKDRKELDKLSQIMGKPILAVAFIKENGMAMLQSQNGQNQGSQSPPANIDPFQIISKLPAEQIKAIQAAVDEKLNEMPVSVIKQTAVPVIKKEYETIGFNINRLQSNYILYSGALMLLIALLGMAASVIVAYFSARVSAGFGRDLRNNIFSKVLDFSNSEFDKFSTASLITRSTNDIQQVQMFMVMLLRIVFYAPILAVGGIIKVLGTETSMGWIIAVSVAAMLVLVFTLFGTAIPKFKIIQKLIDRLNLVTRESLTGMLVIRAFSTQNHEENKFDKANRDITHNNLFVGRIMTIMMPMMMLILNATTILIVWVGAKQVDLGRIQVGDMMAFIQYAMQIIFSFLMISFVSIMLPRASVSAQRIGEVLSCKISIEDAKELKRFNSSDKGYIEFKDVCFRYPGAEDDVLSGITFVAKPGQTTAFIGSTGSGKSTLVNLIPRFYDVTSGQILIDGTDIREVPQHELRDKIGYVPQKGVLFSGTIESNIKYGKEDLVEDELITAAEIAQAADFINEKPEKFKSEISQGGTNVSGGQKQRLSIARALAKKPEIFIFDDSFSALDFKTDAALRKALKENTAGSTVLIVAQRISTIMNADQIIVLDEGRIAGKGKHEELMRSCEVYNEIALSQLSKEELQQ